MRTSEEQSHRHYSDEHPKRGVIFMLEINKIHEGDALNLLKMIPDNSIQLIITDPPYNIDYKSNHTDDPMYDIKWDKGFDINPIFAEMRRIMSPDGVLYLFGRWDTKLPESPSGCLIWDKMDYGMGDLKFWSMSYEFIFIYKNGLAGFKYEKRPQGIIRIPKIQNFASTESIPTYRIGCGCFMDHPTQKPVELIRHIIKLHDVNTPILDPFMGSGTLAVACKQLGKDYIGIEINPEYIKIAEKRLNQDTLLNY